MSPHRPAGRSLEKKTKIRRRSCGSTVRAFCLFLCRLPHQAQTRINNQDLEEKMGHRAGREKKRETREREDVCVREREIREKRRGEEKEDGGKLEREKDEQEELESKRQRKKELWSTTQAVLVSQKYNAHGAVPQNTAGVPQKNRTYKINKMNAITTNVRSIAQLQALLHYQ